MAEVKYKIEMDDRIRQHWIGLMESGQYKEFCSYHCKLVNGEWCFSPTGLLIEAYQAEMRELDPTKVLMEKTGQSGPSAGIYYIYSGNLWSVPDAVAKWAKARVSSLDQFVYKPYAEAVAALRETVK